MTVFDRISAARFERLSTALDEWMLELLADEFDDEIPGVDYELNTDASDEELSKALWVSGMFLLTGIILTPPLNGRRGARTERRLLRRTAETYRERALNAGRFLTHGIIDLDVLQAQVATRFSHRLDFTARPPAPIEVRAQRALSQHMPIGDGERDVLTQARDSSWRWRRSL